MVALSAKTTICLVGPFESGKSSMLRTWTDSFHQGTHGFDNSGIEGVKAIPLSEFQSEETRTRSLLGAKKSEFDEFRAEFFGAGRVTRGTESYTFEVRRAAERTLVEIIDSAGELSVKSSEGAVTLDPDAIEKLTVALEAAPNVIVAVPMIDLRRSEYRAGVRELINGLTDPGRTNPQRLVIAFTHYERLFYPFGRQAFRMAADPGDMRSRIEQEFRRTDWHANVEAFARLPGREAFLTASGAFGFLADNGSVNIDPHRRVDADADLDAGARERAKLAEYGFYWSPAQMLRWRPFLTADPFLCALLGESGSYAIKLPGASGVRPPPHNSRPPPEPKLPLKRSNIFTWGIKKLKKATNAP